MYIELINLERIYLETKLDYSRIDLTILDLSRNQT
jgi:hypothetical protein